MYQYDIQIWDFTWFVNDSEKINDLSQFSLKFFSHHLACCVLHQYEYASLHFDGIYDSNMDTVCVLE